MKALTNNLLKMYLKLKGLNDRWKQGWVDWSSSHAVEDEESPIWCEDDASSESSDSDDSSNDCSHISIFFYNNFTAKRNKAKVISLQWKDHITEENTSGRSSFTYESGIKSARHKNHRKDNFKNVSYYDFSTVFRERSVINYFAGFHPWQQRLSNLTLLIRTFIVLQKFAAVILIVHWLHWVL